MIKRFHALYVGQIDLDNVGLNGTPANDRRYSNERLSEVFATSRRVARVMDELGYYCFWAAEHHFQHEGYECIPNLIQWGLWLATQTQRLKFGCGFNILPMWHPIRLAEDYAMADIVTDGRVIMGIGRGYHTREVETFGAPLLDAQANRELFEEQLELLLKCFNDAAFHHKGKYYECPPPVDYRGYKLKDITLVPRPKHLPVEVWMPIASGKTIDLMARKGLKAMVTLNGEKILDDVIRAFHDACRRHGRDVAPGQDMCWGAGITSLANQMSCSLNSLGDRPSAQWIMKFSSPGYLSATDLMPSMTCAGGPQNQAFCATPSRSEGTPAGAPGVPQVRPCSSA